MGRPGVFRKPDLDGREHREFNDALHRLHLLAGRPTLTIMARELREAGISRSSIHDAFSSTRLPQWHVVDALLEILASRAPGLTAEQQLEPMHALWLRAAEAEQHSVTPSTRIRTAVENRTILLFDIVRFGHHDGSEQAYLRRALYEIADRILAAAGIDETRRRRADRGDGIMEIIEPNASLATLLQVLLLQMPERVRAVNRTAPIGVQLKLRGVLAKGYVAIDDHNWAGTDLDHAHRLLDAPFLREELPERNNDFVLCLSDPIYQGILRHGYPGIPIGSFRREAFHGKHGQMTGWLTTPV